MSRKRHEAEAAVHTLLWFHPDSTPEIQPDQIQDGLAALPTDQREVIVAYLCSGLTFQKIASLVEL
jgi:DNA-directed RNA polymerase specialized sigma24 family protein